MKKRILALVMVMAMAMSVVICAPVSAAEWFGGGNPVVYENNFEETAPAITVEGANISTEYAKSGTQSYVLNGGGSAKINVNAYLPASYNGKWMLAELWYRIDGSLPDLTVTPHTTWPDAPEQATVEGAKVTLAYLGNGTGVSNLHATGGTALGQATNSVFPKTKGEAGSLTGADDWERIRVAFVPRAEDLATKCVRVSFAGAEETTKIYIDDFKLIQIDNIVDFSTHGNSDFETYTAYGINGWTTWNESFANKETYRVEYGSTENEAYGDGRYCLKIVGERTDGKELGIYTNIRGNWYEEIGGKSAVIYGDARGYFVGDPNATWLDTSCKFYIENADGKQPAASGYGAGELATKASMITIPTVTKLLKVSRGSDANTDGDLCMDNVTVKLVDTANGFVSFSREGKQDSRFVEKIKNGDTIYPVLWVKAVKETPTRMYIARYAVGSDGTKILDNVYVKDYATLPNSQNNSGLNAAIADALVIPETGNYYYKCMGWDGDNLMSPFVLTTEFTVGQ